jgi:sugar/nucleoside kinase (ribokinase family)
VWRTPHEPVTLRPALASLPASFRAASAFHLGVHPLLVDLQHLAQLRAAAEASFGATSAPRGALLSIEPYTSAERLLTHAELRAFCSAAHVVSPNEAEAISMVGPAPPAELVARLVAAGAAVVALRRGPEGAIVHCAATGETWDVPTVAGVAAVDPTGCGNAFCGGFLASWRVGESLLDAGVWVRPARGNAGRAALTPRVRQGCVAASFMVRIGAGKSSGSVIR